MNDKIVVGIFFGDESKGSITEFLAHEKRPESVVRYGGGPQTAHNVVQPDGTHHTFAQFGSASLQEVPTTLSRFMLVNPFNLVTEGDLIYEKTGWNPFPDLLISEEVLLITPIHVWLNKQREDARGADAHGSCGEGIGETRLFHIRHGAYAPVMGDLLPENIHRLQAKLQALYEYAEEETGNVWNNGDVVTLTEEYKALSKAGFLNIVTDAAIIDRIRVGYHIFEGSQGVLLDESFGFHPHTTWSSVTAENAQLLLAEAGKPRGVVVAVLRSYMTRHGFGPFPSEIPNTEQNVDRFPEIHNTYGQYQGGWRRGYLDLVLLDYAIRANGGVDMFALTHADVFEKGTPVVVGYNPQVQIPSDFFNRDRKRQEEVTDILMGIKLEDLETVKLDNVEQLQTLLTTRFNIPVRYVSYGATYEDKVTNS